MGITLLSGGEKTQVAIPNYSLGESNIQVPGPPNPPFCAFDPEKNGTKPEKRGPFDPIRASFFEGILCGVALTATQPETEAHNSRSDSFEHCPRVKTEKNRATRTRHQWSFPIRSRGPRRGDRCGRSFFLKQHGQLVFIEATTNYFWERPKSKTIACWDGEMDRLY